MTTATLEQSTTMAAQSVNVSSRFPSVKKNVIRKVTNTSRNGYNELEGFIRFRGETLLVVRPRHSRHWRLA